MDASIKEEVSEIPVPNAREQRERNGAVSTPPIDGLIELSSDSDSDSDVADLNGLIAREVQRSGVVLGENSWKKRKTNNVGVVLPLGFLSPLPPTTVPPQPQAVLSLPAPNSASALARSNGNAGLNVATQANGCKQFWKAGDFDGPSANAFESSTVGMDHVRVHPKFLHSNATSHKWALGDNGGGMDPDKMRQCMSLGYSAKSKVANTIGQCNQLFGLDYEGGGRDWNRIIRTSTDDWNKNVDTIVNWSPFYDEPDLLRQFNLMKDHGTRVIIYNLWEDDQGQLELDFDIDQHDIQIRGVNRDEKNILMAKEFPNSRHFLTYRHSLRSYASILYLRLPPGFRIILRGKDIVHHNIVNDMMMSQEMVAAVTIGFVKDAVHHIDVSGFNVYHKNRLIKPFWRIWNPAGSGVLEANFVEPAHDKQGFEQTSPENVPESSRSKRQHSATNDKGTPLPSDKLYSQPIQKRIRTESEKYTAYMNGLTPASPNSRMPSSSEQSSSAEDVIDQVTVVLPKNQAKGSSKKISHAEKSFENENICSEDTTTPMVELQGQYVCDDEQVLSDSDVLTMQQLKEENSELKKRLERKEDEIFGDAMQALRHEKDRCTSLDSQLRAAEKKIEDLNKEQETLIDVFSEERDRRDAEEKVLRKKLQDASNTIQELLDKVRRLERKSSGGKPNR
ncbi:hypothetical protein TanjilG_31418 [Lupinus angustifolius]|uniref:Morc S5 domain-containing protein n=1 Tax=Lupinus angustifolius TaxID=3871 RepID=A0A4P1RU22_LUPAN|nr:hypothetical protein TanjilG_31418 [Lupinus angustifolius]